MIVCYFEDDMSGPYRRNTNSNAVFNIEHMVQLLDLFDRTESPNTFLHSLTDQFDL